MSKSVSSADTFPSAASISMNSPVRVLVVPNEMPVPANSGGRIDVWRRLLLLRELNIPAGLLTWYDRQRSGEPSAAQLQLLESTCDSVHLSSIGRSPRDLVRRLGQFGRLPSHAAARWVSLDRDRVLAWAKEFGPSVILLDGLYGVAVVRWLAAALGVPWIYRAHNIEHRYMRMQMTQATRWSTRCGLFANQLGLEFLERRTVREADVVLDISPDDAAFWCKEGCERVTWLPTLVDSQFASALAAAAGQKAAWDALYFGNLHTPNNVEAVRWLVTRVLPLVPASELRIAVAGSNPSPELEALVRRDARIHLLPNPDEMASLVGSARVLLNPVQGGSGVNLKSVEMLFSNAWLLSTPTGVHGLPAEAAACFVQEAEPQGFADALRRLFESGVGPNSDQLAARKAARAMFSGAGSARILRAALTPPLVRIGSLGGR